MRDKRSAYAAFEKTILDLYERRILTLEILNRVAMQYRQVRIDSAGSRYLRSQDGKDLHQICIELVDPSFPIAMRGSREDHDEYWEKELRKWEEIVHNYWRWSSYCTAFPGWRRVRSGVSQRN